MASEKRCLYEILGLNRDCSPEEIRSAYKKLALQRHPDKLMKTGIPEEQATAAFQELVNAYEVLSDPRERSWYDSHRSQILFSETKSSSPSSIPDIFSFFSNSVFSGFGDTGKGFYKVYGDFFGNVYAQELSFAKKLGLGLDTVRDAPLMGNFESPYTQVSAFYSYWLGFCTVMDFCWVDQYEPMAGFNRKARRFMEEENKKLRKKAKKEYNDSVRGLAEFVKKRDKRVIEMQMKRNLEMEERREKEKARRKEAEREKLEKAMLFEEPEWTKINEEIENAFDEVVDDKKNEGMDLYCVVCSKKFKSDKQWKNHEQSKKHKEKVAELRFSFDTEDKEEEEYLDETQEDLGPSDSVEDVVVDELSEKFEDALELQEQQSEEVKKTSSEEEEEMDVFNVTHDVEAGDSVGSDDEMDVFNVTNDVGAGDSVGSEDETIILKAMLFGHKNRKKAVSKTHAKMSSSSKSHVTSDNEEMEFMQYDTRKKNSRRNRAAKKEAGKKSNGESERAEISEVTEEVISNSNGINVQVEEDNGHDNSHTLDPSSHAVDEVGHNSKRDPPLEKDVKDLKKPVDKRGNGKGDMNTKSKNTSRGKKQKGGSKSTGLLCETCGENFDSRNKLHMHLGDTGHATLKSR